jgi:serine protease Do
MKKLSGISRKALVAALYGAAVCSGGTLLFPPPAFAATPRLNIQTTPISPQRKAETSVAPVVKKAAPSVVYVYTTTTIKETPFRNPFLDDPAFRFFFGDPGDGRSERPRQRHQQGLGSGVVVSEDGYVLTANHVVEGADEVKVLFAEGKKEYVAKVIGTDPPSDIAVLKIEADPLPAITLTDSDNLEVGDLVIAVGNPFGVGQTVTTGIVSAKGRGGFGIVDYEDFIQTDASINPGNSGGALVDAEGRLVGINSAIISRSGGNQGIGFAVPINMARVVLERLIKDGKVTRGFLGVNIQPVTPELAKAFNLPSDTGALVGGVSPKTPAADAGLKEGDVILEFNGKKVVNSRQLRLMVSQTPPDTKTKLKVMRDGKEKIFNVTLGELPSNELAARAAPESWGRKGDAFEGVQMVDLDARSRRQYGFDAPDNLRGALVTDIDPGSAAFAAGLRQSDVIVEVNRKAVNDVKDVMRESRSAPTGSLLLRVWSSGGSHYVVLDTTRSKR